MLMSSNGRLKRLLAAKTLYFKTIRVIWLAVTKFAARFQRNDSHFPEVDSSITFVILSSTYLIHLYLILYFGCYEFAML